MARRARQMARAWRMRMNDQKKEDAIETRIKSVPRNENMTFPTREEVFSRPGLPEYMRVFHGWDEPDKKAERRSKIKGK